MDRFLTHEMDSLGIPGLSIAIINEGRVVYHRALGVADVDSATVVDDRTIFEAASLTKPVFAYLVMRLAEQGVLDLDTPLYRYIPVAELWNGWYDDLVTDERHAGITARTVLSHTTGLPNWRWDNPDGKLAMKFAPGSRFSYSGEGYEMLADVLAHLLDTDLRGLSDTFRREVAVPLAMEQASIAHDPQLAARKASGHVDGKPSGKEWCCNGRAFMASGGMHTEAKSYANFLIALMEGKGLSKTSLDAMLKPQVQLPEDATSRIEDGVTGWGLGLAIRPSAHGPLHLHGGSNTGYRSGFLFHKEKEIGYVLFTNSDRGGELSDRLTELFIKGSLITPSNH